MRASMGREMVERGEWNAVEKVDERGYRTMRGLGVGMLRGSERYGCLIRRVFGRMRRERWGVGGGVEGWGWMKGLLKL